MLMVTLRPVAGRGSEPPEISTVTFLNRVNLWTFCVGVGVGLCAQGLELEVESPELLYPATSLITPLFLFIIDCFSNVFV